MLVRNRMSIAALKKACSSEVKFINNPKTGKLFFACAEVTGYVSPKAAELVKEAQGNSAKATELSSKLQYAECCKEETDEWVPCLMVRSTDNVVMSI